jgi:hypothetical protein
LTLIVSILLSTFLLTLAGPINLRPHVLQQKLQTAIPKKPRTPEDYKSRTLRELASNLPAQTVTSAEEGPVTYGDIVPSSVRVVYRGSTRRMPKARSEVIRQWALRYAGSPEHYTSNRETELLFSEDGVDYWLSLPKRLQLKLEKESRVNDEVLLYLIRLGAVQRDGRWDPILLVEDFNKAVTPN